MAHARCHPAAVRAALIPLSALTLVGLAARPGPLPAADKAVLSGKEIFQRTLKSMVWIVHRVELSNGRVALATGSGSLIDVPRRLVLTNYHVVGNESDVTLFFPQFEKGRLIATKEHYEQQFLGGAGLKGKVLARDPKRDLALVELKSLPAGAVAIPLAKEGVGPGETVHSIGNPAASDALWAYTRGEVKTTYRKSWDVAEPIEQRLYHFEAQVVETTSPINPGDSGGPLLNDHGELVAVTQGAVKAQGTISYFIDVSEVRGLLAAKKLRIAGGPAAAAGGPAEPKAEAKEEPKADPKAAAAAKADKEEREAANKLAFAREFVRDRPERARDRLEEIVKNYPNTRAAKEAKELLANLRR
jgi:S1-C subfamily serine protease